MRQAIVTKYHGPTNTRGSRVSAACDAGKVFLVWDNGLDYSSNYMAAAEALVRRLVWQGLWRGGGMPSSSPYGYCFVRVAEDSGCSFLVAE